MSFDSILFKATQADSGSLVLRFWAQLSSARCSKYMTCIELLSQQAAAIIHCTIQSPQYLKAWSTWYIKCFLNITVCKRAQLSRLCTTPFINYTPKKHFFKSSISFSPRYNSSAEHGKKLKFVWDTNLQYFLSLKTFPLTPITSSVQCNQPFYALLLSVIYGLTQWIRNWFLKVRDKL